MAIPHIGKIDLKSKKNIESLKHSLKEKSKIERFLKKNSLNDSSTKLSNKNYLSTRVSKKMPNDLIKKIYDYSLKIPDIEHLSILLIRKVLNFHYYSLIITKIKN